MKKILIVLFLVLICTTGCWNYRELDNLAIVGALGIDYDPETKEFITSIQIFNAKKSSAESDSSESTKSPVTFYENRGKTINEAIRYILRESPRRIYGGHLEVTVLGETVLKEKPLEALDFLFRDSESRKDFELVVAKDCSVSDVLKILTPLDNVPSTSLLQNIKMLSDMTGIIPAVSFDRFLYFIYGNGIEPFLPAVTVIGDKEEGSESDNTSSSKPKGNLKLTGTAIFKDNKLVGYLDEKTSMGINFAIGNMKTTIISFPCDDDNYASIELIGSNKYKLKTDIKNNKPIGKVEANIRTALTEINCSINLESSKEMEKVEKMVNKEIKKIIESAIKKVQTEYQSDVFGFGAYLYHNNNKYWQKNKNNWNEVFSTMQVDVKVNAKLIAKGSSVTTVKEILNDQKK